MSEISASQMMPKMMPPTGAAPQALASDVNASKAKEPTVAGEPLSFAQGGEEAVRESLSFAESQQASIFEMDGAQCHPEGEAHSRDNQGDDNSGGQQGDSQSGSGSANYYFERKDEKKSSDICASVDCDLPKCEEPKASSRDSFSELIHHGSGSDLPLAVAGAAWITAAPMPPPLQPPVNSKRSEPQVGSIHTLSALSLAQPKRGQAYAKTHVAKNFRESRTRVLSPKRLLILLFILALASALSYYYSSPLLQSTRAKGVLNSLSLRRESAARDMGKQFDQLKQKIRSSVNKSHNQEVGVKERLRESVQNRSDQNDRNTTTRSQAGENSGASG